MRKRNIKKQVWLNKSEAELLRKKSRKVGINESTFIRDLILGYEPKEKPDDKFYEYIKELRAIGNNLNQIATKANSIGFINVDKYNEETKKLNKFIIDIKKNFLLKNGV
ncbi:MAG: MobC family plasmid mobilization relaxosome protein [Oscillospiraceae bacterium]|nr:MobC family plasmid mobilization relaxosome protein [Oscillospiraceae bacterium]